MIALLEAAAVDAAVRTAAVTPEGSPSYGELLDDARQVAGGLRRRGVTRSELLNMRRAYQSLFFGDGVFQGGPPVI